LGEVWSEEDKGVAGAVFYKGIATKPVSEVNATQRNLVLYEFFFVREESGWAAAFIKLSVHQQIVKELNCLATRSYGMTNEGLASAFGIQ
jgi:hypothetical protein